jgi:hypothetical protein
MVAVCRVPDGSGNPLPILMGKDWNEQPVTRPKTFFDLSCLFEDFVLSIGQQMVNYAVILYLLYSF